MLPRSCGQEPGRPVGWRSRACILFYTRYSYRRQAGSARGDAAHGRLRAWHPKASGHFTCCGRSRPTPESLLLWPPGCPARAGQAPRGQAAIRPLARCTHVARSERPVLSRQRPELSVSRPPPLLQPLACGRDTTVLDQNCPGVVQKRSPLELRGRRFRFPQPLPVLKDLMGAENDLCTFAPAKRRKNPRFAPTSSLTSEDRTVYSLATPGVRVARTVRGCRKSDRGIESRPLRHFRSCVSQDLSGSRLPCPSERLLPLIVLKLC